MAILGPIGGATRARRTITLGGATETLANGSVSIGGITWTAFGIGAGQSAVGIYTALSNFFPGFDGDVDDLYAAVDTYAAITYGEETTGLQLRRSDSFGGTFYNFVQQYRGSGTASRFLQVQSQCGSTPVSSQENGATTYAARRLGMWACNTITSGAMQSGSSSGAYFGLSSMTRQGHEVTCTESYTGASGFGTSDIIEISVRDYLGTDTGAISIGASGLQISLGGFVVPLSALHLAAQVT